MPPKYSRIFDGKAYELFGSPDTKSVCKEVAEDARSRGYNARIVPVQEQDYGGDYRNLYLVYTSMYVSRIGNMKKSFANLKDRIEHDLMPYNEREQLIKERNRIIRGR